MFNSFFKSRKDEIDVVSLNDKYLRDKNNINNIFSDKKNRRPGFRREHFLNRLFVLEFSGDTMATQANALAHEITAIISSAKSGDKVLIKITSPGGAAHAYGYASSQIERLKKVGIPVTVAIDQIAASGGYMMACVADYIIAAPYAIVGSVGVVAEFPNVFNLLRQMGVDYKQYTVGKYKRTVSTMGEITDEGEQKFLEDLKSMYDLFRDHVENHRPELDMDIIATGEHWHGITAQKIGLVDDIMTSEEYVSRYIEGVKVNGLEVLQIKYIGQKKNWFEKFVVGVAQSFAETFVKSFVEIIFNQNRNIIK